MREHREKTYSPCLVIDLKDVQNTRESFKFFSEHCDEVVVDFSTRSFTLNNILGDNYEFSDQMDKDGIESFLTNLSICREVFSTDRILYASSVMGENC